MNKKLAPQHHLKILKPLQITSFGKLSLSVNGKCLDVQSWASPKVYQLLLTLIAAGGKNISTHEICDAIWSNQDADHALQNLEFTLRSLRNKLQKKLPQHIRANKVILLHHGKISFHHEYCDLDSWRLDTLMKQTKILRRQGNQQQAYLMEHAILQSIRGSFMMGESDFIYHHRQTWHTRLCHWIHESVCHWQKEGHRYYTHIIDLLDWGIKIDPYSECLLRLRMDVLHKAGYSNDAIRYYQDWSSLLLQSFGLKPSKKTHKVYCEILSAQ